MHHLRSPEGFELTAEGDTCSVQATYVTAYNARHDLSATGEAANPIRKQSIAADTVRARPFGLPPAEAGRRRRAM